MSEKNQPGPSETQIRQRAYEIYAERGFLDGNEEADWLQAEVELTEENRQRNRRSSAPMDSLDSPELSTIPGPRTAERASHNRESLSRN